MKMDIAMLVRFDYDLTDTPARNLSREERVDAVRQEIEGMLMDEYDDGEFTNVVIRVEVVETD